MPGLNLQQSILDGIQCKGSTKCNASTSRGPFLVSAHVQQHTGTLQRICFQGTAAELTTNQLGLHAPQRRHGKRYCHLPRIVLPSLQMHGLGDQRGVAGALLNNDMTCVDCIGSTTTNIPTSPQSFPVLAHTQRCIAALHGPCLGTNACIHCANHLEVANTYAGCPDGLLELSPGQCKISGPGNDSQQNFSDQFPRSWGWVLEREGQVSRRETELTFGSAVLPSHYMILASSTLRHRDCVALCGN